MKNKIWDCKIIVSGDSKLPNGFDAPPRRAAINAIENSGIDILSCSSGWGGETREASPPNDSTAACEWVEVNNDYGTYETGCDQSFTLIDGTPEGNGFEYCTYCGKKIKDVSRAEV